MKRFAYACLGVLALALAFRVGAVVGQSTRFVAMADYPFGGSPWVILVTDTGDVWSRCSSVGWQFNGPFPQLPFPVSELRATSGPFLLDHSDNVWEAVNGGWGNLGSPPGAVALSPSTWGQVKAGAGR